MAGFAADAFRFLDAVAGFDGSGIGGIGSDVLVVGDLSAAGLELCRADARVNLGDMSRLSFCVTIRGVGKMNSR